MTALLTMEHLAGTSIERACEDACRVANLLSVGVQFSFNSVKCCAYPQGSSAHLAHRWQEELSRKDVGPIGRYAVTNPEAAHKWFREREA